MSAPRHQTGPKMNPYPAWAPRFWHGMLITDWLRLLAKHRFRMHPMRWGLACTVTLFAIFNSKMRLAQAAILGHRMAQTPIPDNPVFILGHWRSGTTLLHELMAVDDRLATPTTYQCFAANHFPLTEAVITRLLWFLMPNKRPMDNVAAGWHEPQEDEFALCSMGLPSPYLRIAFPNDGDEALDYLDMDGLTPQRIQTWIAGLNQFLQHVSYVHGKRVVLKSPTHTGRIGLLARTYPQAKFIHISRDPYDVVPSTLRLWKSLDGVQALQIPLHQDLEGYVHRAYRRMYQGYERGRLTVQDNRLIEIQYEDLVEDGHGTLQKIYQQLDLGDFQTIEKKLDRVLEEKRNYKRNEHVLEVDLIRRINHHWSDYFERYGYVMQHP